MADFDPFANQGGPVAWDPEHSTDAKKQAEELNRRLAADSDEPGSGPSPFTADDSDRGGGNDGRKESGDSVDDTTEFDNNH